MKKYLAWYILILITLTAFYSCQKDDSRKAKMAVKYPDNWVEYRTSDGQKASEEDYYLHSHEWQGKVVSYLNKKKWKEEIFENGFRQSTDYYFFPKKRTKIINYHEKGNKEGGQLFEGTEAERAFARNGRGIWYLNDLKWRQVEYKNSQLHGKHIEWHLNGLKKFEKEYLNGKNHGKWQFWYQDGQFRGEINYKNGWQHGRRIFFYKNGQKLEEGFYANGSGQSTIWYKNGNKKSQKEYKQGQLKGKSIDWYENGNKKSETSYEQGKFIGKCIEWFDNRQKKSEAYYIKPGQRHDKFITWDKNGEINRHEIWQQGKLKEKIK